MTVTSRDHGLSDIGFAILPSVLSKSECHAVDNFLASMTIASAGSRNLLDKQWCSELGEQLRSRSILETSIGDNIAVQCTYFDKGPAVNWLVPLHQDLSIPVKARVDRDDLTAWSVKDGRTFVQAPTELLEQMIAVRLHVDDNGPDNGPLRVVPGSHRLGRLSSEAQAPRRTDLGEVECHAPRGDAVLMKPLLLHASSKATGFGSRRVLHFLYGPERLPFSLEWAKPLEP